MKGQIEMATGFAYTVSHYDGRSEVAKVPEKCTHCEIPLTEGESEYCEPCKYFDYEFGLLTCRCDRCSENG